MHVTIFFDHNAAILFILHAGSNFCNVSDVSKCQLYNLTMDTMANEKKLRLLIDQLNLADKIIYIFIVIFTILGNTLVLVATWRERRLHEPNKYFIASLAVADLMVGMFVGPLRLYQLNLDVQSILDTSVHLCRFMVWIDTLALTASIYILMFISFDRYLKISKPLHYKSRMTTSNSLKIIFIIWFISTAFATYAATPDSGSKGVVITAVVCLLDKSKVFYTFLAVTAFFLPTMVILVMYAFIFVVVHKRHKMLRNGELGQISNASRSAFLQDIKTIKMLVTVVGVFTLCWGPYFISIVLFHYNPSLVDIGNRRLSYHVYYRSRITYAVIYILPYFNSLCNPIIYAYLDQNYKQAFKNLFQRIVFRSSRPQQANTRR